MCGLLDLERRPGVDGTAETSFGYVFVELKPAIPMLVEVIQGGQNTTATEYSLTTLLHLSFVQELKQYLQQVENLQNLLEMVPIDMRNPTPKTLSQDLLRALFPRVSEPAQVKKKDKRRSLTTRKGSIKEK